jgi:predicted site-specific integrase-resolvase
MFRTANISKWPAESSIPKWSLRLGYNSATLYRYYAKGRLKGRKLLNGRVMVTKEAICECLNIQAKE